MKIKKVELSSNNKQVNRKNNSNPHFAVTQFGLKKMQKGNLTKDVVSFGSPVVEKKIIGGSNRFITGISKFIDDFEEATKEMRSKLGRRLIRDTKPEKNWAEKKGMSYPKTEYSASETVDSYKVEKFWGLSSETKDVYENYKAKYLGGGISGDVYSIYEGYSDSPSYVMKEVKKKKHSDPIYGPGGIMQEFENLKKYGGKNFQTGIALMKTRDGNFYLVSKFEDGEAAGIKHLSPTESKFNPIMTKSQIERTPMVPGIHGLYDERYYVSGLFHSLKFMEYLDQQNLFNSDLNIGNILFTEDEQTLFSPNGRNVAKAYCEKPILIDLQWLMPMYKAEDFFTFAPNEKRTNFASFEAGFVASYLHGLNEYNTLNGNIRTGKEVSREFLRSYLQERAKYCDPSNRFERLRQAAYQDLTDDVLDAEILRLSILKNHSHQFLYNDGLNETPRDMLKGLRYMARANFSAKMLSEFKPQGPVSDVQREYFEEMRKLGSFWHGKTQKWYREGLESMQSRIIQYPVDSYQNGDEQVYWPKAFGQGVNPEDKGINSTVPDKTMLSDILSSETKAKWDDVMEDDDDEDKIGLKTRVIKLEAAFVNLKTAIDTNDTQLRAKAEKSINILTGKVLQ